MADLMINKKDYAKAIRYLEDALDKRWKRPVVRRYHYILGQLYQAQGKFPQAAKHYRRVMRSFAPEAMKVNATINYSYLADGRTANMRQTLIDMTKKQRYEDYYDMIYFALAELEARAGNEAQAVDYYTLAIEKNTGGNAALRTKANYKLALYFEKIGDYEQAQKYYSNTAELMSSNDPNYKTVQNKAKNLNILAENLRVIRTQDTLQRIARMSEAERAQYVERCIAQAKESEQKAKDAANRAASSGAGGFGAAQGAWYFNNPAILEKGKQEFKNTWGNRRLADNWRYAAQNDDFGNQDENTDAPQQSDIAAATSASPNTASNSDAENCLRDVPFTEEQMSASHKALADALLGAAKAYRNYMYDNPAAIKMLEDLLKRYPFTEHKLEAYFYLYAMYLQEKDNKRSDEYKQKILDEFPNSEVAQVLINPNYSSKSELIKRQADTLFEKAYKHYTRNEYGDALRMAQTGVSQYKELPIAANFALLQALAKGRDAGLAGHIYNLQLVVSAYPNTDAAQTAQSMIDYLKGNEVEILQHIDGIYEDHDSTATDEDKPSYGTVEYSVEEGKAMFVIGFDPKNVNINQLRFDVTVFNTDMDAVDLTIETEPMGMSLSIMKVGIFQRPAAAMEYYRSISASPTFAQQEGITMFVITEHNLELLMTERFLSNYVDFFHKNMGSFK
jgi:tetratricopeptide (TPR) repeat protein